MKISVWHQFSSNHSASYEIVGQFESNEAAEEMKNRLIDVLSRIGEAHVRDDTPDKSDVSAELEIGKQYGINWATRLNGFWMDNQFDQYVFRFENCISISTLWHEDWKGFEEFKTIIEQYAQQIWRDEENGTCILINLTCSFTESSDQAYIYEEVLNHFNKARESDEAIAPWQKKDLSDDFELNDNLYGGRIYQDRSRLNFENLYFQDRLYGLSVFVEHLKAHGAGEIDYQFFETDQLYDELFEQ